MIIPLSIKQIQTGTEVGKKWHEHSRVFKYKGAYNISKTANKSQDNDIRGAISELVVAETLGLEWNGLKHHFWGQDGVALADIGDDIQVRSTSHSNGNLIIHPKDNLQHRYVLVRTHNLYNPSHPSIEIVGWTFGKEAKQKKFWKEPQPNRGCYLFPSSQLKSFVTMLWVI